MYMYVDAHGGQKKTSDALELTGVTGDYEPPNMGAGTWNGVIWKSRKHP